MNSRFSLAIACLALIVAFEEVSAVEVLTAEELASHCVAFPDDKEEGPDWQWCVRYIQGFIDGAIATDIRVMLNLEAESEGESFSERAIRTRVIDRNSLTRAAGYAEFCLGDPLPLAEVVQKVVDDLSERMKSMDSAGTARDVVYEALRRHYPCK